MGLLGAARPSLSVCVCVCVLYKTRLILCDLSNLNSSWTCERVATCMHAHVCVFNQTVLDSQQIVHAYWEDTAGTKRKENNHVVRMKIPVWPSWWTMWPYPGTSLQSFWWSASPTCLLLSSLSRETLTQQTNPSDLYNPEAFHTIR